MRAHPAFDLDVKRVVARKSEPALGRAGRHGCRYPAEGRVRQERALELSDGNPVCSLAYTVRARQTRRSRRLDSSPIATTPRRASTTSTHRVSTVSFAAWRCHRNSVCKRRVPSVARPIVALATISAKPNIKRAQVQHEVSDAVHAHATRSVNSLGQHERLAREGARLESVFAGNVIRMTPMELECPCGTPTCLLASLTGGLFTHGRMGAISRRAWEWIRIHSGGSAPVIRMGGMARIAGHAFGELDRRRTANARLDCGAASEGRLRLVSRGTMSGSHRQLSARSEPSNGEMR